MPTRGFAAHWPTYFSKGNLKENAVYKTKMVSSTHRKTTYPTVSLQGLHKIVVRLCVEVKPLLVHVLEVQVFVGRTGFFPFFPGRSPLVRGSFQIIFVVHFDRARQDVVHHHQSDVYATGLDAVQAVKLWQQCSWILVQVLWNQREHGL